MKIKIIALITCLIMLFSLPSYGAAKHKKVISKPPLEFDYYIPENLMNEYNLDISQTCIIKNTVGYPEINILEANTSKKTIIAFEYKCSFLDGFDRPVFRVGTKNPIYYGIIQGVRIPPSGVAVGTGNLVLYELANKIKPNKNGSLGIKLIRVKFSDNTEWKL